jgi:hypothetical protein
VKFDQLLKYSGSFVGKDFKVMAQIGPILFPKIMPEFTALWMSLGLLVKLLYHRNASINMGIYAGYIREAVSIFQHQMKFHFSEQLHNKVKLHLLVHFADYYLQFGPLCEYAAEVSESQNKIVRGDYSKTNHHSPSRDILNRYSLREFAIAVANGMHVYNPKTGKFNHLQYHYSDTHTDTFEAPSKQYIDYVAAPFQKLMKSETFNERVPQLSNGLWLLCRNEAGEEITCQVIKTLQREKSSIVKVYTQTDETDLFGNYVYNLSHTSTIQRHQIVRKVQVVHHCSALCTIGSESMEHYDDEKFIVNSYHFDNWDDYFPDRVLENLGEILNSDRHNSRLPQSRKRLRTQQSRI